MLRKLLATLPLLVFVLLVLFIGYATWRLLNPAGLAGLPATTRPQPGHTAEAVTPYAAEAAAAPTYTAEAVTPYPAEAAAVTPYTAEAVTTYPATTMPAKTAEAVTPYAAASPTGTALATPTARPASLPLAHQTAGAERQPSPPPALTSTATPTPAESAGGVPGPATLLYVRTNDDSQAHSLWCLKRDGRTGNLKFHDYAAAPAWSPDGRQVIFFGEAGINQLGAPYQTGIWRVDYLDYCQPANPRLFLEVDHVKNIAWSPDGTKLAFEKQDPASQEPEIWVVDAGDGLDVVDPDSDRRIRVRVAGRQPAWSPDSQKLVLNTCEGGDCGLWQYNFLGERERQLTADSTDSYPTWSLVEGTGAIAFAREMSLDNWDIYLLRLDGATRPALERAGEALTDRPDIDTAPVFGPGGRELYIYTNHEGGGQHWRIETLDLTGQSSGEAVVTGIGESKLPDLARPSVGVSR